MSSFAVEFTWLYRFFAASIAFCQVPSRSHRETDFVDPFRRSRPPRPGAVLHEFIVVVIGDAARLCICPPRFLTPTSSAFFLPARWLLFVSLPWVFLIRSPPAPPSIRNVFISEI